MTSPRYRIQLLSVEQPDTWIDSAVDPYSTLDAAIERAGGFAAEQHVRIVRQGDYYEVVWEADGGV